MNTTKIFRACAILVFAAVSLAGAITQATATETLQIAFRLDQRITRGLYMGDRWVTPDTFTQVQDGDQLIVAARTDRAVDWVAADSDMLTITHTGDNAVSIAVNRVGETTVAVGGVKTLGVKAIQIVDGVLRVDINQ